MKCQKCGNENPEYVSYCGQCGESVGEKPSEVKPTNVKREFPVQGRSRRSVLVRYFALGFFAYLLIKLVTSGGDVFDIAFLAMIAALVIMPFLVSRYRRRQDSLRSVDYPRHMISPSQKEPLKATLHRSLIRIEGNWTKRCEGVPGRLARLFRRGDQVIGFGTENERVTLTLSWDRRVTLSDSGLSKHDFDLDGPEEEMIMMLENARDIRSVPSSIRVRMRGRDPRPEFDYVVRDTIAKLLRILFR